MKHFIFTFFSICCCAVLIAQYKAEYTYRPFIMDGTCVWLTLFNPIGNSADHRRMISNEDSVHNNISYKKIYDYTYCSSTENDKVCTGIIREKDKRVYYIGELLYNTNSYNEELLLYDFNLKVDDEFTIPYWEGENKIFTVSRIDTLLVEGIWRRKFYLSNAEAGATYDYWLEGIGCKRGLVNPFAPTPTSTNNPQFRCVSHDNHVIYRTSTNDACMCENDPTHLSEQMELDDIHLYVKDQTLFIKHVCMDISVLEIYASDGRHVFSSTYNQPSDQIKVPLHGWVKGAYIVVLYSKKGQKSGRFIFN